MLLLTILILSLMAVINYRFGGKALLYPPFVFCGIWAFDLFLVWLAGDFFYPMLPQTLFIFICGALAFSLGSGIATLWPAGTPVSKLSFDKRSQRIITLLVVLIVAGLPFYYRWIAGLVATSGGGATFLLVARMSTQELIGKSPAMTIFGTLSQLSHIVALIAFYEREHHPKRAFIAVAVSMSMGILMGQKVGPLSLVVGMICLDWLKTRRLRWKMMLVMVLVFAALAGTIEFYVHLGGESRNGIAGPVMRQLLFYASGGLVACDRLVRDPTVAHSFNPINDIYQRVLRRLGQHVDVPEVTDFTTIGPNGLSDNVYTIYLSYLELGYFGSIMVVGAIGFVVTWVYRRALQGTMFFVLLFAVLFRGVVFSTFNDNFSLFYFLALVSAVVWLVYYFPAQLSRFGAFVRRGVEADLVRGQ